VRKAVRQLLNGANTFFYSRDASSSRHLEKVLERPNESIVTSPDIVFGFQGGNSEQGKHILRSMGCGMSRPIIGLAPNKRIYDRVSGKGMGNKYLHALVKLAEHCYKNHDVDIVLQANQLATNDFKIGDRHLCSLIAASVNASDRCFMTREYLSAEETKSMIGQFDYLIGSQFHSLVFGFSQGVPGMSVSWSHKYRELFSLFGMENYVQECQNIDAEELISTFERGWRERNQQRVVILEKVQQLQQEVNLLFNEVADKINGVNAKKNV
jgi:polysaccharide pyruvyl transferase WcaK-like protein